MNRLMQLLFFALLVRPVMLVVLGLNVRRRELLPVGGPAVLVANHNSHLDTVTLMSLLPLKLLPFLRPVGASDYFFRNPLLKWFALRIMGIIPLQRKVSAKNPNPLSGIDEALARNEIVLLFPEGSRGVPEEFGKLKGGIARVSESNPDVPIVPVFMHGLGKALPKGEALLVPFFLDVFVGESMKWSGDRKIFMEKLETRLEELSKDGEFSSWE